MRKTARRFRPLAVRGTLNFRRSFSGNSVKVLLALPAMLTLAVGMQKREPSRDFEFPAPDPELNARFDAYVGPMSVADQVARGGARLSPEKKREFAQIWLDGYRAGNLKSISSAAYGDSIFEGAAGQIVRTQGLLFALLDELSRNEMAAQKYDLAAEDATRALGITQVMRYSDLNLNSLQNAWADRALDVLQKVVPNAKPGVRAKIAQSLPAYRMDGEKFAVMAKDDYLAFVRSEPPGGEGVNDRCPNMNPVRDLPLGEKAPAALNQVLRSMHDGGTVRSEYPFETTLSRALLHEAKTQQKLEAVLNSVSE